MKKNKISSSIYKLKSSFLAGFFDLSYLYKNTFLNEF